MSENIKDFTGEQFVRDKKVFCASSYAQVTADLLTAFEATKSKNVEPASTQQILDCSSDPDIMTTYKINPNNGCTKGSVLNALEYCMNKYVETEKLHPF